MPDYDEPPVDFVDSKMFQDWLKKNNLLLPRFAPQQKELVERFMREGLGAESKRQDRIKKIAEKIYDDLHEERLENAVYWMGGVRASAMCSYDGELNLIKLVETVLKYHDEIQEEKG